MVQHGGARADADPLEIGVLPAQANRRPFPLIVLNPSRDGFTLPPPPDGVWPETLVDCYAQHGFDPAGQPNVGRLAENQYAGSLKGPNVEFDLPPYGWEYSAPLAPPITEQIRARGGFILVLTHAVVGEDIDAPALDALLSSRDYVQTWVPVPSPAGDHRRAS